MKRRDFLQAGIATFALGATRRPRTGAGPDQDGAQGVRRSPARLSDGRSRAAHGQEAGGRHRRPSFGHDVPVDAARRRKGNDRAGPARRVADGPHFRRRRRSRGGRRQRLQHAVRFPQLQAHGSGDRRRHRQRIAGEDFGEREDRPDRAVLDECRLAQHLQQQAADQDHGGPQGSQGPHDGQPAVRRHHECARRQRRRARLRPGFQSRCRPA